MTSYSTVDTIKPSLVTLFHIYALTGAYLILCAMARGHNSLLDMTVNFHRRPCGDIPMTLNQACLRVKAAKSVTDTMTLEAQSKECYGCPMWTVWEGGQVRQVPVNTSWPTELKLSESGLKGGHCRLEYHFGEFGYYEIGLPAKSGAECDLKVIEPPVQSLMFILYAFVALLVLRILWLLGLCLLRTRWARSRWMYYRHGVSIDVQDDLSDDRRVVSPTSEERHSSSPPSDAAANSDGNESEALVAPVPRPRARVRSLDVLRGISVALMIYVNYGGGNYWFFRHSPWNGLTVADLVFPWFLWVMGASLVFSINSQLRRGVARRTLLAAALRRSAALVFLGLFLNSGGKTDLGKLRLPGVLQRFGLAYFIVASIEIMFLQREHRQPQSALARNFKDVSENMWQFLIMIILIVLHTSLTFLLPVPGCPTGYLGPGGLHNGGKYFNCTGGAAGLIDRTVFGNSHIYQHPTSAKVYDSTMPYDPEGMLGVLTSAVVVMMGCHAAKIMLTHQSWRQRSVRWLIWAAVLGVTAGGLCGFSKEDGVIPVNKNLWSLSFAFATTSMAFCFLTLLYLTVDVYNLWFGGPFVYAGMNPILLYVGHELCRGYFPFAWRPFSQTHIELVLMNVWATSLWLMIAFCLYRKDLFISL